MTGLGRRLGVVAGLLAAMAACAAYGFLLRPWKLFPYSILFGHHSGRGSPATPAVPRNTVDEAGGGERRVRGEGGMPAAIKRGVTTYDPERAEDGLNFFTSAHAPLASLIDMNGAVVRTWMADVGKIFTGRPGSAAPESSGRFIRDAELLPDGGILALFDEIGIVRLDANSRVVWSFSAPVDHDVYLDATGTIWALAHERRLVPVFRRDPVLDSVILELSPDGKLLRRVSVLDSFRKSTYASALADRKADTEDLFQASSVIVLDGTLADRSPAFRRGNLLISSRNLGMIAIVDPDQGSVVWALTGLWHDPRNARLLPAGHLLLFDDLGSSSRAPRVLEVDPFSQDVVWSFGGSGEPVLGSAGYVARLRGGNTLITETHAGRVREVTRDGQVVWEFVNPNRVGKNSEFVAFIYLMERVPRDLPFLSGMPPFSSPTPPATGSS